MTAPLMAMERVPGRTLIQTVDRLCRERQAEPLALLADAWLATATTLEEAGFVHGDLAPDNLIVRPDGSIALVDLDTATWPVARRRPRPQRRATRGYAHPRGAPLRPCPARPVPRARSSGRHCASWPGIPSLRERWGDRPDQDGAALLWSRMICSARRARRSSPRSTPRSAATTRRSTRCWKSSAARSASRPMRHHHSPRSRSGWRGWGSPRTSRTAIARRAGRNARAPLEMPPPPRASPRSLTARMALADDAPGFRRVERDGATPTPRTPRPSPNANGGEPRRGSSERPSPPATPPRHWSSGKRRAPCPRRRPTPRPSICWSRVTRPRRSSAPCAARTTMGWSRPSPRRNAPVWRRRPRRERPSAPHGSGSRRAWPSARRSVAATITRSCQSGLFGDTRLPRPSGASSGSRRRAGARLASAGTRPRER